MVLSMTNEGDLVVDPYIGAGSSACAAVLHGRRAAGADTSQGYLKIAASRLRLALDNQLIRRPLDRPVYVPGPNDRIAQMPLELEMSRASLLSTK